MPTIRLRGNHFISIFFRLAYCFALRRTGLARSLPGVKKLKKAICPEEENQRNGLNYQDQSREVSGRSRAMVMPCNSVRNDNESGNQKNWEYSFGRAPAQL
jgi:hypothetical protein